MSNAILIIALLCYIAAVALSKHSDLGPAAMFLMAAIGMHVLAHRMTYQRFRKKLANRHEALISMVRSHGLR